MTWNDFKILKKRILHTPKLQIWYCLICKLSKIFNFHVPFLKKITDGVIYQNKTRNQIRQPGTQQPGTPRKSHERNHKHSQRHVCTRYKKQHPDWSNARFRLHSSFDGYIDKDAYYSTLKKQQTKLIVMVCLVQTFIYT